MWSTAKCCSSASWLLKVRPQLSHPNDPMAFAGRIWFGIDNWCCRRASTLGNVLLQSLHATTGLFLTAIGTAEAPGWEAFRWSSIAAKVWYWRLQPNLHVSIFSDSGGKLAITASRCSFNAPVTNRPAAKYLYHRDEAKENGERSKSICTEAMQHWRASAFCNGLDWLGLLFSSTSMNIYVPSPLQLSPRTNWTCPVQSRGSRWTRHLAR